VIDYTAVDIADATGDIDVIVDALGGESSLQVMPTLKPGGLLLPVTGGRDDEIEAATRERGIRLALFLVEPDHVGLEALAALADAGRLRVEIDAVFPLEQAAAAHERGETGRTRGKLVLAVAPTTR
jgi:NADPH:quinone reductase-like Zn-dependent oxidoreductase